MHQVWDLHLIVTINLLVGHMNLVQTTIKISA